MKKLDWRSIAWNCLLIIVGAFIYALGIKTIAYPQEFVAGGLFGTALLLSYVSNGLSPNIFYVVLNIPLFIIGYMFVSKRFFYYTMLAVVCTTLFFELITFELPIDNSLYAALAGGFVTGIGVGTMLRSLGSGGGLDIVAVILHTRLGISFGRFFIVFHLVLFTLCFLFLDIDLCIASMVMVFVSARLVDEVVSSFSQRKVVQILSESNKTIAKEINTRLKRGSTFIKAYGAYSNRERDILMTVINNIQLKRLENLVFDIDPDALFIVEDSFTVLGSGFSQRKKY
jgi:uncharacterized membrane-anchored protein YitT (DUF2179 family)